MISEPAQDHRCDPQRKKRTKSNGVLVVVEQCNLCGRSREISKASVRAPYALPDFDPEISNRWWQKKNQEFQEKREADNLEWFKQYDAYLLSDIWRHKRTRVLDRAGGICESCGTEPAAQVHHESYRYVGNEPLFDLRAVCFPCHEAITEMSRSGEKNFYDWPGRIE